MPNRPTPRGEVTVGRQGRMTGFYRLRTGPFRDCTRYTAEVDEETGVITLTPVVTVSAAEFARLRALAAK